MPIRVKCGECKKTLSVKDHLAGKKIKCPVCQSIVAVPTATGQNGAPVAPPTTGPAAVPKKPLAAGKPAMGKPLEGKKAAPEGKKPTPEGKIPPPAVKKPAPEVKNPIPEVKNPAPAASPRPELEGPPPENAEEEALSILAEELKPKEVEEAPKTIDFKCEWCDEMVQLPLEMGGKQSQCPNPECRRIIKVPMPKIEAKKDWRKMDRAGPVLARINQPEQLENAWGTQDTTRARQESLAKAGAIDLPPRPPLGVFGWLRRGLLVACLLGLLGAAGLGTFRLYNTSVQHKEIKEIKQMVEGPTPKITHPLLRAEAHRTLALIYLHSKERKAALEADPQFGGAQSLIPAEFPKDHPGVHEQLFLIDLALSEIELAGEGDDLLRKTKLPWEDVQLKVTAILQRIQVPEVQVMAMREVATRLHEKNQDTIALGVAGSLTRNDPDTNRPSAVFSQQIALLLLQPSKKGLENVKEPDPAVKKTLTDTYVRIGYAEGYARQGKFSEALALARAEGPARDRLQTCLGVAAIALAESKNKEEASKFVSEALKIVTENKEVFSPWLLLHLVKLGERSLDLTTSSAESEPFKKLIERLPEPFKLRGHLEKFLAQCDRATGPVAPEELLALESADKEGTTLALGWNSLAQQHARKGNDRTKIRKTFADGSLTMAEDLREKIRPMVDVGAYLGAVR